MLKHQAKGLKYYCGIRIIACIILVLLIDNSASAQITPDATLPSNTTVRLQDNTQFIEGGTQTGSNLFHSFREFSVPTNSTAYFNNGTDIQNIISRVTGGFISNIDGLIRTNGSANLFLINPSGIIFGSNARLDIGGSFVATTATSLKFADGFEFSAITPQTTPLLTVNVPIGLQFGINPGKIQVIGDGFGLRDREVPWIPVIPESMKGLRLSPNQTLALVGGDISLEGATLKTPGGRVELASVGDNSLVKLNAIEKGFSFDYGAVQNLGNIQLFQKAAVDSSGEGGGDVFVTAKNLTLQNGSTIEASTLGSKAGGSLIVNVREQIKFSGVSNDIQNFPSGLYAETFPNATGKGGDIIIKTSSLLLDNGAEVSAATKGQGMAGNLIVDADQVQLTGNIALNLPTGMGIQVYPNASGSAGELKINTRVLRLQDGGLISTNTFGAGNGGGLTINATDSIQLIGRGSSLNTSQQTTNATGSAGNLNLNTRVLHLQDGAQVNANTYGAGNGGNLTIEASEVKVIGTSSGRATLLTTQVEDTGTGSAGNLSIKTRELFVQDGAQVVTGTQGSGKGGDLIINATDKVRLQNNQARIVVKSLGTGNAGNLTINSGSIRLENNTAVDASTTSVNKNPNVEQATINLRSQDLVLSNSSKITANAKGTDVIGGNIDIKTGVLAILENSKITADSNDFAGGRVRIDTQKIFRSPDSVITAIGKIPELKGEVQIKTSDVDALKGTVVLPVDIVDGSQLINKNFCARAYASSFVITGRRGLSPSPYEILEDYYTTWEDWRMNPVTSSEQRRERESKKISSSASSVPTPIIEAQGWVTNNKGEVELVAFTPHVTPHNLQTIPTECK